MAKSKIEWTQESWNPIVGCSVVSPGCTNCYAMKMAARLERMGTAHYAGTTKASKGGPVWTGKLALAPEKSLTAPLLRRKPTTYFVNSMGDLFHEDVPDEWIDRVFAVMALAPQHTFQVLTKRADRMREYVSAKTPDGTPTRFANIFAAGSRAGFWKADGQVFLWPLPNVWLGVSAEDQTRADERIPDLLATPAAVRFVSAEPLLGPVDLTEVAIPRPELRASLIWDAPRGWGGAPSRLDWVIVGGESGRGARPMHPDWARSLRDQCQAAGTAFFFKQWGGWAPGESCNHTPTRSEHTATWWNDNWSFDCLTPRASEEMHHDDAPDLFRVGKARAGRLLDGVEHNAMPGE